MISLLLTICVLSVVMLIRNQIVYMCVGRAIDEVHTRAKEAIEEDANWEDYYLILESYPSYDSMVYNPLKWTYRQFYPGITERLAE